MSDELNSVFPELLLFTHACGEFPSPISEQNKPATDEKTFQ